VKVTIHTILALKQVIGNRETEIDLPEGTTVKSLLAQMVEIWGDQLSPHLFQPGSDLLFPYIRIMVNGQAIQFLKGVETVLGEGDEVLLLPLAAGG
jgi:molybdopterin synthase sulfur carrier subunit